MTSCPFCSEALSATPKPNEFGVICACTKCMNPVVLTHDGTAWQSTPPQGFQDIREVTKEGSIGHEIMRTLPQTIDRLPILPKIAQQILAMVRDPDVSIKDLAAVINNDQVIAAKILRLANSAIYGGLTEIKELSAACARIGLRQVGNAVLAIANGRLYVSRNPVFADMMESLWRHAMATAYCAHALATLLAEPRSDIVFVAGLVHDIGKVLLIDLTANPLAAPADAGALIALAEAPDLFAEILSDYHALVGLHILQSWGLPSEFLVSTFCHDVPDSVPSEHWLNIVHIVCLANAVANVEGFAIFEQPKISLVSHPSTKFLGLTDFKLATLRVDLEDKIAPLLEIAGA